ncbi:hypothetical protein BDZ45DRAFT_739830 [Acephala macrosclerotiorum]|nr:hypothetical protein BDZ45DRAFT_739830 [Acephala macrosclerotiorum]
MRFSRNEFIKPTSCLPPQISHCPLGPPSPNPTTNDLKNSNQDSTIRPSPKTFTKSPISATSSSNIPSHDANKKNRPTIQTADSSLRVDDDLYKTCAVVLFPHVAVLGDEFTQV